MDPKAFAAMSYGMYVVTSLDGDKSDGQIADTVFQVTAEPPQIAVSLNKENLTCEYVRKSRVFAVTVLSEETPLQFIGRFGFHTGRDYPKFDGVNFRRGTTGANIVTDYAVAYFEAEVTQEIDVGTHCLFVGRVVEAAILSDAEPMTYDMYHKVKGGLTQKNAPTYRKP